LLHVHFAVAAANSSRGQRRRRRKIEKKIVKNIKKIDKKINAKNSIKTKVVKLAKNNAKKVENAKKSAKNFENQNFFFGGIKKSRKINITESLFKANFLPQYKKCITNIVTFRF
jgi:hypothetical protein